MSVSDKSALVSARLCHDLISPIGAIGNGLELLQMASEQSSPELTLISESLETALAKLRFFRLAFGPADSETTIAMDEVTAVTDALYRGRLKISWSGQSGPILRQRLKLIFLSIMCLEKSLPLGGEGTIDLSDGMVSISVIGTKISRQDVFWSIVHTGQQIEELRSDAVQYPLLHEALRDTNTQLDVEFGETRVHLALKLPILQVA